MTVGNGHFTAFVRASNAGCRSHYKVLCGPNGNISKDIISRKDKRFAQCLDAPREWRRFPWQAEVAWPQLADLCQRALNSSHGVTTRSGEVEVMAWIAEQDTEKEAGVTFEEILQSAAMSNPICSSYMQVVGRLAIQISCGGHAPTLQCLGRVERKYGEHKILGEIYVQAVADLFISKSTASIICELHWC